MAAAALVMIVAACSAGSSHRAGAPTAATTSTPPAVVATTTAAIAATTTVVRASTTIATTPLPPGTPITWTVGPWAPAGRAVAGSPAVFTTTLQPTGGGAPVGAARLDTVRLRFALYAGPSDPGGSWSNEGAVPAALWPALVATFNSGFKLSASRGGFYADGRAARPLRDGAASFVIFQDGSATVGDWGRDVQLSANVVAVRQNLELLVDGGRPSPQVATNIQPTWGFTLNNQILNWRSAVGVDNAGEVLYVGGPGLGPAALAGALVAVGAVRAMELDINPAWVTFNTFTGGGTGGGISGTKLLPGMSDSATRFLSTFSRDFFAVFAR